MAIAPLRVVSWNVHYVIGRAARREAEFLSSLDPPADIVLLQEVNRHSAEDLRRLGGMDWLRLAVDLHMTRPDEPSVRQRGVAIGGARIAKPISFGLLDHAPFPERAMRGLIKVGRRTITLASYHAPPGVTWKLKKVEQAVSFAEWLRSVDGPVLVGADANTPRVDHPDFELLRTHWHTGSRRLKGMPGDDVMWGSRKSHHLQDALRRWFAEHPTELSALRSERPEGPLAVSFRTGRRNGPPPLLGTPRRFDAVWVSSDFEVRNVQYPYEASLQAGSDHSAVVGDLILR